MTGIIETDMGYCDWEVIEEPVFDSEGNEVDSVEYVRINNLEISEDFRGLGHGRVLLQKSIDMILDTNKSLEIKIVAEPKSEDTDLDRLVEFYESFSDIDEVVAV